MEGFVEDCSSTGKFVDWNFRRYVCRIIEFFGICVKAHFTKNQIGILC
jgi:hypothetical protein